MINFFNIDSKKQFDIKNTFWLTAFNNLEQPILFLNLKNKILYYNNSFFNLLDNLSHIDIIGKSCCEIFQRTKETLNLCPLIHIKASFKQESSIIKFQNKYFKIKKKPIFNKDQLSGSMLIMNDISFKIDSTNELEKIKYYYNKRIKELNCIYKLTKLVENQNLSIDEVLKKAIDLIPFALQFPSITTTRIIYDKNEYVLSNFYKSKWKISTIEKIYEKTLIIEVFYLEDKDFLKEEEYLLKDIGKRLKTTLEQKYINIKLKKSEEKYRLISENANDLICILDEKMKFEFINERTYKQLLNYSSVDLIGKCSLFLIHPEDLQQSVKLFNQRFNIGTGETEMRIKNHDGNFKWFDVKGQTFIDSTNRKKALLISRDISKRKDLERTLNIQNKELKKLGELKSEFLRRASHELKTPLIAIKGFANFLLRLKDKSFDSKTVSMLKEIDDGCSRLEIIINNIIESSRLESSEVILNIKEQDLSLLINFCLNEQSISINNRKHQVKLEIENKIILNFDKEQIYEVITNLLNNAIKYTLPNGLITVASKFKDNHVIISIKDSGVGFTEDEKDRVFKQFGKIERYGKGLNIKIGGSGLGLYIAKRIIDLHKGKIWVESEGKNRGSTFYFSLPLP